MKNLQIYQGLKACTEHVWMRLSTFPDFLQIPAIIHLPVGLHLPLPENSAHFLSKHQSVECVRWMLTDFLSTDIGQQLIQALEQDEVIAQHLNVPLWMVGQQLNMSPLDCIINWTAKFIYDYQDIGYNDAYFDDFYILTEGEFYKNTTTLEHVYGVCCLYTDDDHISVDSQIYVKKLSPKDRIIIQGDVGFTVGFVTHTLHSCCEVPKVFGPQTHTPAQLQSFMDARDRLDEFCSALRLFKSGHIGVFYTKWEYPTWIPAMSMSSAGIPPSQVPGSAYKISHYEVAEIKEFWEKYQTYRRKNISTIDVALRRLDFGYERHRPEDKIIDYMIGFESLFLKNDPELSYKLSLRVAYFLSRSQDDRKKIFNDMKRAYNARSNIVHGNKIKTSYKVENEEISLDEIATQTEGHLRNAIRLLLELGKSRDDVINLISEMIICGT